MNTKSSTNIVPALFNAEQAATYVGLSERLIWKMSSSGAFPPPVKIEGARVARWRRSDLDRYVEELGTK